MTSGHLWCCLAALLAAVSCRAPDPPERGFYYWKTRLSLDERDAAYLKALGVDTLYLRFFDVAWDEVRQRPTPVGSMQIASGTLLPQRVVPVVFITIETLAHMGPEGAEALAANICNEVEHLSGPLARPVDELQIDCDWTPANKQRYFQLLREICAVWRRRGRSVTLTATIRLHQIRHRAQTGVPPVARGVLMAYNTSSPTDFDTRNAILDLDLVAGYLSDVGDYPLPLDPALPLFSWAVQYDANKRFVRLLKGADPSQSATDFQLQEHGRYRALRDTFLNDKRIMAGDLIEWQGVTWEHLQALAELLENKLGRRPGSVILFDYDPDRIEEVTHARPMALAEIFAVF